jgi:hypothetical protein
MGTTDYGLRTYDRLNGGYEGETGKAEDDRAGGDSNGSGQPIPHRSVVRGPSLGAGVCSSSTTDRNVGVTGALVIRGHPCHPRLNTVHHGLRGFRGLSAEVWLSCLGLPALLGADFVAEGSTPVWQLIGHALGNAG